MHFTGIPFHHLQSNVCTNSISSVQLFSGLENTSQPVISSLFKERHFELRIIIIVYIISLVCSFFFLILFLLHRARIITSYLFKKFPRYGKFLII